MAKHTDLNADHLAKRRGAKVFHNTTQSRASGEALVFNSEEYDDGGFHDTGSNTSRLTAPETGTYDVWGWVETSGGNAGSYIAFIREDGTTSRAAVRETNAAVTVNKQLVVCALGLTLNAGQYVELCVALPASTTMAATCRFMIRRVA